LVPAMLNFDLTGGRKRGSNHRRGSILREKFSYTPCATGLGRAARGVRVRGWGACARNDDPARLPIGRCGKHNGTQNGG